MSAADEQIFRHGFFGEITPELMDQPLLPFYIFDSVEINEGNAICRLRCCIISITALNGERFHRAVLTAHRCKRAARRSRRTGRELGQNLRPYASTPARARFRRDAHPLLYMISG